jgi:mercuric ion binding protein
MQSWNQLPLINVQIKMKQFLSVCTFLFIVFFSNAQGSKKYNSKLDGPFTTTKTIKVDGVCEVCEHTIEGALKKSPAIYFADWDAGSKLLFVKYDRSKISVKKIEEMVAATGHNTANVKADTTANKPLPDCCKQDKRST